MVNKHLKDNGLFRFKWLVWIFHNLYTRSTRLVFNKWTFGRTHSVAVNTPFARKVRTPSYPGPRQCRCSSHGATADFVDRKTVRKNRVGRAGPFFKARGAELTFALFAYVFLDEINAMLEEPAKRRCK